MPLAASPTLALPYELLVRILEVAVAPLCSQQERAETLGACLRVSKIWQHAAKRVFWDEVELTAMDKSPWDARFRMLVLCEPEQLTRSRSLHLMSGIKPLSRKGSALPNPRVDPWAFKRDTQELLANETAAIRLLLWRWLGCYDILFGAQFITDWSTELAGEQDLRALRFLRIELSHGCDTSFSRVLAYLPKFKGLRSLELVYRARSKIALLAGEISATRNLRIRSLHLTFAGGFRQSDFSDNIEAALLTHLQLESLRSLRMDHHQGTMIAALPRLRQLTFLSVASKPSTLFANFLKHFVKVVPQLECLQKIAFLSSQAGSKEALVHTDLDSATFLASLPRSIRQVRICDVKFSAPPAASSLAISLERFDLDPKSATVRLTAVRAHDDELPVLRIFQRAAGSIAWSEVRRRLLPSQSEVGFFKREGRPVSTLRP
ncbi:hypothetical protein JCM10908_000612 [Rhodotorula pacifica]|uniref:uncharacterized protein n=1 Tax=Rhodotorula pacifica TaxID=1495444 RepID=UPI00316C3E12